MQIKCPFCGLRDEIEFTWGGEAHLTRPENPESLSDEQWADYLFTRKNPKGIHHERWCHTYGCGSWFNLSRNTVSHKITRVYPVNADSQESDDG